jgi:hypothetical protein
MKITSKTTKQELANVLGANAKVVKEQDKNLYDQMAYTSDMMKKDEKKVTRRDLVDLVKDVINALGDKFVEPALAQETPTPAVQPQAENAVKKLTKGVSKKQEMKPAKEEPAKDESTEEQGAEKAPKKSLGKKSTTKKSKEGVTDLEPATSSDKAVQLAKMFPKEISVGDDTYELAEDIKTFDDLYDALEKDEDIVFAYYWTKRHLKQFDYFMGWLGQPKSFDNDLDLATAMYVSDEKKVAYQISMYTEAVYTILPTDFEEVDGVRVAGGIEYQIYRKK